MKETYLAWLPCEQKGCFGIYDGCIEPQATGRKVKPYLEALKQKATQSPPPTETWPIDAGTWYFGEDATQRIAAELHQN